VEEWIVIATPAVAALTRLPFKLTTVLEARK
jgi:hypothetical protein